MNLKRGRYTIQTKRNMNLDKSSNLRLKIWSNTHLILFSFNLIPISRAVIKAEIEITAKILKQKMKCIWENRKGVLQPIKWVNLIFPICSSLISNMAMKNAIVCICQVWIITIFCIAEDWMNGKQFGQAWLKINENSIDQTWWNHQKVFPPQLNRYQIAICERKKKPSRKITLGDAYIYRHASSVVMWKSVFCVSFSFAFEWFSNMYNIERKNITKLAKYMQYFQWTHINSDV